MYLGHCHPILYKSIVQFKDFYRATGKNTHGIAIDILSDRLSVKRVYCDKTR